jgi:formylglycine-generating enzyme required for sulfatase activity
MADKKKNIGGVELGNIKDSHIEVGSITTNVNAEGDVVAGNKIVNIHYERKEEPAAEKPRQPYEPEMVGIAAGPFTMGSDNGEAYESPPHMLNLPAYEISQYPITNAQYFEYVKQAKVAVSSKSGWELARVGHAPPQDKLSHPIVGISWDEAVAYCEWLKEQTGRKYRLPTEAEWEKAARGDQDTRSYPWGNDWDSSRANNNGADTTSVDQYPAQSLYECYDMAGNVWEWTSTMWGRERSTPDYAYPYPAPDQSDGRDGPPIEDLVYREYRICRGGSYKDKSERLKCSSRARFAADSQNARRGFRVVREL